MKTLKPLIALVMFTTLAAAAGTAVADDITVNREYFVAYKSRAEMRAEVAQARAQGQLQPVGEGESGVPAATPKRDETQRDARRAATTKPAA